MSLVRSQAKIWNICALSLLPILFPAAGHSQDGAIDALKKQMAEMHEAMKQMAGRIQELEKERAASAANANTPPPAPQAATSAGSTS